MLVKRRQSGVSLLEVLIAMALLSLGMLAAIGLQLVARRSAVDADARSLAAWYAFDLSERIRANNRVEALALYASAGELDGHSRSPPPVDCRRAACAPGEVALFDLWDWERQLAGAAEKVAGRETGGLARPTVCLSAPGGAGGLFIVTIAWRGSSPLPADPTNDCGAGSGLYGAADEYRRSARFQAYVAAR